jgi:hypothetical protein
VTVVTEQRENIKSGLKSGETATASFQMMKQAYGDNAVPRTWVFEWYARFRDGRENLEDDECSSNN